MLKGLKIRVTVPKVLLMYGSEIVIDSSSLCVSVVFVLSVTVDVNKIVAIIVLEENKSKMFVFVTKAVR